LGTSFWLYALPNYAMAALMYSLLARYVLAFFMAPDTGNYIYRFFVRITDPVAAAVRFVSPAAVPAQVILLFGIVWLLILRFAFFLAMTGAGLAPTLEG
jgi:YggT family protein